MGVHLIVVKAHRHLKVIDDLHPGLSTILDCEESYVEGFGKGSLSTPIGDVGIFPIIAVKGRHHVDIAVHRQATDDGQTDIGVDRIDEISIGVFVEGIDDDEIGGKTG